MTTHPLLKQLHRDPTRAARYGDWTVEPEQGESNDIGIKADALHFRRDAPATRDARSLAEGLSGRVGYLLEPLTVVEVEKKAMLRSKEPTVQGEDSGYYELWLSPEELSVQRYQAQKGERRRRVPLNLTWEQAHKFVEDVQATYQNEDV